MTTKNSRRSFARRFALPALFAAGLAAAPSVRAANYIWDPSGNRSDAAGSGTWDTTTPIWDNGAADVAWNNAGANNATFNGADGTYALTVANGINAVNVTFNASGYTLAGASAASPGTLNTPLSNGFLLVANGKTLTIGANMNVFGYGYVNTTAGYTGGTINIASGGVLTPGTFATLGGNYNVGAGGTFGNTGASYIMSGATVSVNGAGAQFIVRGMSMTNTTFTLTQGTFNAGGGSGTSLNNSTLNLNGGTFVAGYVPSSTANSTINFNGTLVQNTIYGGFIGGSNQAARFVVQAGGAKFDLYTSMTLSQPLQHDAAGAAIDGGLFKVGNGLNNNLTLSAANTYNGGTTVANGTLVAAVNGALGTGDVSVLATSVSLSISTGVTNPFNNVLGRLSLAGGGTAGTADVGYLDLTSGANILVGSLTLGGTTYTSGVFSRANFPEYFSGTGIVTVVPEPGSLTLVAASLLLAGGVLRRVRRN